MLWILRRTRLTGAAAFFNAINNNSESRPARKEYSKLSSDEPAPLRNDNDPPTTTDPAVVPQQDPVDTRQTVDLLDTTDSGSECSDPDFDPPDYTDDSDYDEFLTCNVCDRSFPCHRQLASHKQKKRHFGCSACDSLFPSLMALEHHKEEFDHWSGDDDILTDTDEDKSELTASEECERLL